MGILIKTFFAFYLVVFGITHIDSNLTKIAWMGAWLNLVEFVIMGGHFYNVGGIDYGIYTTHASGLGIILGDIFHIGDFVYFSIGDILLVIALIWSFLFEK